MTLDKGFKLAITQDGRSQKSRLGRWDRRRLCKSVLLEQPEPHAPPLAQRENAALRVGACVEIKFDAMLSP